jgi:hypothetical protein
MGSIGRAEARLQYHFNSAFDRFSILLARRQANSKTNPMSE